MATGDPTSHRPPDIEAALDHFGEGADLIVEHCNSEPGMFFVAVARRKYL
jgi:hypothetical protein